MTKAGSGNEPASICMRQLVGGKRYEKLFKAVRRRLEDRGLNARSIRLRGLDYEERQAIADLHGWKTVPDDPVRIDFAQLDQALKSSRLGVGVIEVLEALGGPLIDRSAQRMDRRLAREQVWRDALEHPLVQAKPELVRWLDDLREYGILRRAANAAAVEERTLLDQAFRCLGCLPADGCFLAVLAAEVTGNSHALDMGQALAGVVLRGAACIAGWSSTPANAAQRRQLWADVGVLCDSLSSHVLVFGLRPTGSTRLTRTLRGAANEGEPVRVTLREISNSHCTVGKGTTVFVCENPGIVAVAADRLGSRCHALLCVDGVPSIAALQLLRSLHECEANIRFHADFDWGGIKIGNKLVEELTAMPWHFGVEDYRRAIRSIECKGEPLSGKSINALWDPELADVMRRGGRAIYEEQVIGVLLDDLGAI